MGWADNLQKASFRGVEFDVLTTNETISRDFIAYEYPHVDGADVIELGRKARPYRLSAFLWGATYEYQLQALTAVLDEPGNGELIHPIYGSIPAVIVASYDIRHDAEGPDSCTVDLNFIEVGTDTALFQNALPELAGNRLFDYLDSLNAQLADLLDAVITPLNRVTSLVKRAKTVQSVFINTLLTFKSDVTYSLNEIMSIADHPKWFVNELSNVLNVRTSNLSRSVPVLSGSAMSTIIGLPTTEDAAASAQTVLTNWSEITAAADEVVNLPVDFINGDVTPEIEMPATAVESDVIDIAITYQVATAAELAATAAAILADDEQAAQLTPNDIERLVNDVRARIQETITALNARYQPERPLITETEYPVALLYIDVVNSLKTVALTLHDLALLILSRRPPLTRKTVQADSSFILLAHLWYADYRRADELQRLNRQITEPNRILKGMVINAYAR